MQQQPYNTLKDTLSTLHPRFFQSHRAAAAGMATFPSAAPGARQQQSPPTGPGGAAPQGPPGPALTAARAGPRLPPPLSSRRGGPGRGLPAPPRPAPPPPPARPWERVRRSRVRAAGAPLGRWGCCPLQAGGIRAASGQPGRGCQARGACRRTAGGASLEPGPRPRARLWGERGGSGRGGGGGAGAARGARCWSAVGRVSGCSFPRTLPCDTHGTRALGLAMLSGEGRGLQRVFYSS